MAKNFLGENFSKTMSQAKQYTEMADQMKQIEMLFVKRTQVIILDISILKHFIKKYKAKTFKKDYVVHALFPRKIYSAGFKSRAVRDQFNRGLLVIKANGKYQEILNKYLL